MGDAFQGILLPGGVLPAELAYPEFVQALGSRADVRYKELEVYAGRSPPPGYTLDLEVEGVLRLADRAGFDRFHLVGYSASGAICFRLCSEHAERLQSMTVTEPDWPTNGQLSPEEKRWVQEAERILDLPDDQMVQNMAKIVIEPGVELPPSPPGPSPPWMENRPAGLRAFMGALAGTTLDLKRLRSFTGPVLFVLGGRSNQAFYRAMAGRLGRLFPDFTLEVFDELHHFNPPHRAQPERFARLLLGLWERAEQQASRVPT